MQIAKSVFNNIMLYCPAAPPEIGGIIGGHGECITSVIFDATFSCVERATYCPDVIYLNDWIARWNSQNIEFRGIFHSHPTNQYNLSDADREYIIAIMYAMPMFVEDLFFPIVIPKRNIYVYRAIKKDSKILIKKDWIRKI